MRKITLVWLLTLMLVALLALVDYSLFYIVNNTNRVTKEINVPIRISDKQGTNIPGIVFKVKIKDPSKGEPDFGNTNNWSGANTNNGPGHIYN